MIFLYKNQKIIRLLFKAIILLLCCIFSISCASTHLRTERTEDIDSNGKIFNYLVTKYDSNNNLVYSLNHRNNKQLNSRIIKSIIAEYLNND